MNGYLSHHMFMFAFIDFPIVQDLRENENTIHHPSQDNQLNHPIFQEPDSTTDSDSNSSSNSTVPTAVLETYELTHDFTIPSIICSLFQNFHIIYMIVAPPNYHVRSFSRNLTNFEHPPEISYNIISPEQAEILKPTLQNRYFFETQEEENLFYQPLNLVIPRPTETEE